MNTTSSDEINITVTAGNQDATDLVALNAKTNQQIDVSALTSTHTINGTAAELTNIYSTNSTQYNGLGDENITIDDAVSVSQATTISGYTSGDTNVTLSASVTDATEITALDAANGNGTIDGLNLTGINGSVTEINTALDDLDTDPTNFDATLSSGSESASAITTLNSTNGTGTVDASSVTSVTGTSSEIAALQDSGITMDSDYDATITGTATTNDVESIFADTSGKISATFGGSSDTLNIDFDELDSDDSLDFGSGDDTLAFDTTVSGDLNFTNISDLENLDLSSANDSITLSDDEPENIDGGAGDDNFTLDFANIDNFTIDGGNDDDTVEFSSGDNTGANITSDTLFADNNAFDNIETLDLTNLTLNTSDSNTEFMLTDDLIKNWTDGDNSLTLKLTNDQADLISFTGENTTANDGSKVYDGNTNSIADNTTYDLGDSTLTIDIVPD